jgi:NADH-quinone oxidoreductase subunit M
MLYERRHTKMIEEFGGLAKVMPVFAVAYMIIMLSSVGLPGLNGFVGEFLILLGSFSSPLLGSPWFAIFGALGVILAAVYLLWSYQRVFLGEVTKEINLGLGDLGVREMALLVPVVIFIVWIGFSPSTFLDKTRLASQHIVRIVTEARAGTTVATAEGGRP